MSQLASFRQLRFALGVMILFLIALAFVARPVFAQQWERGQWTTPPDFRGLNDSAMAIAFDRANNLYVGGYFTDAGGDPNADRIALWQTKTALNEP